MINFNQWLAFNGSDLSDVETKATRAWIHINEKPTTIVVLRDAVFLAAQTVRIEYLRGSGSTNARDTGTKTTFDADVVVFGVRDHPSETDTDLQEGDRFVVDNREIQIMAIVKTDGEIQAYGVYNT
jgi:hypothetical protein